MSSLADNLHASTTPERIVAWWNAVARRLHPVTAIVVAWAALAGPLVFFRGFNSDEGLAVTIARSALEDGQWFVPHAFNVRWVERPTLLSWIIAAISAPFGAVSQASARLVIALFLLSGCLLIYALLRKLAASIPAALVGVGLFLACPLVIRSYVMITADLPLAVLLFFAFFLWWDGYAKARISVARWAAIGVVLALAGLLKGPQPVAYFALGIGLFVLITRSWRQIPGLILAGVICAAPLAAWYDLIYKPGDEAIWAMFMRVHPATPLPGPAATALGTIVEMLPAVLLAGAFLIARRFRGDGLVRPGFVAALSCFAFTASLVMLLWPGGSTPRYYLPMLLALCVLGGLGYDLFSAWRPQLLAPVMLLSSALLAYALIYSALSPLLPVQFRQAKLDADRLVALTALSAPAPIYRMDGAGLNVLPYVPGRILDAHSTAELAALPGPAWMLLTNERAEAVLASRPDKLHVVAPMGDQDQWRFLRLDP